MITHTKECPWFDLLWHVLLQFSKVTTKSCIHMKDKDLRDIISNAPGAAHGDPRRHVNEAVYIWVYWGRQLCNGVRKKYIDILAHSVTSLMYATHPLYCNCKNVFFKFTVFFHSLTWSAKENAMLYVLAISKVNANILLFVLYTLNILTRK